MKTGKKEAIEFKDGYAVGWEMSVLDCFKDSIKTKTFNVGDVFYDSPEAYEGTWMEALCHIQLSIQIQSFNPSSVAYTVFKPNKDRTALVQVATETATADNFKKFFRHGFQPPVAG